MPRIKPDSPLLKPRRDDLPTLKASEACRRYLLTPGMTSAEIEIGGHKSRVELVVRLWPPGKRGNIGWWFYYICPSCQRLCCILRLYDGAFRCRNCDGLISRARGDDDLSAHIAYLQKMVAEPKNRIRRYAQLKRELRLALISDRKRKLHAWLYQTSRK